MKNSKTYYHIIEEVGYGIIGHQGYYSTLEEAKKKVADLGEMFEDIYFYVYESNSKREPEICTV